MYLYYFIEFEDPTGPARMRRHVVRKMLIDVSGERVVSNFGVVE
jgi:hypothetical protein